MSDCDALFRELWAFVGSCPPIFSKKLVEDIYHLGKKDEADGRYECLCWCCRDVARAIKGRLPESVHNRLVLGPQNKHTVAYLTRWGV